MAHQPGQLAEAINKLPAELKRLVLSIEREEKVFAVGEKNHLHIDQIGELNDEVLLVVIGWAKYNDFTYHIIKRLRLDPATAEAITTDINNEIFLPIRESLKKLGERGVANEKPLPPPAPVFSNQTIPVEIPPIPPSIFEQKMGGTFTLPKETPPPVETKEIDPYLEPPK